MKRPRRAWLMIGIGVLAIAALVWVITARDGSPAAQRAPGAPQGIGTVPIDESALPEGEAAETKALERLAKVSRRDAEAAALRAVEGATVVESKLDTEDGFVVWEVDLLTNDGSEREVNVDAGDGKVLEIEIDD